MIPLQRVMFPTRRLSHLLLAGVAALALSACATFRSTMSARSPDFPARPTSRRRRRWASWGRAEIPKDKATIIYYSAALRTNGQNDQAVAVVERGMTAFGRDGDMRVAYAKALSAAGRFPQALQVLDDTIDPASPDWNALSVKGAILDQMGRNDEAPALPAGAGDSAGRSRHLCQSRPLLCDDQRPQRGGGHLEPRGAAARHTSKVRQNYGCWSSGCRAVRRKPQAVRGGTAARAGQINMNYIRALLTQQNRWDAIKGDQG